MKPLKEQQVEHTAWDNLGPLVLTCAMARASGSCAACHWSQLNIHELKHRAFSKDLASHVFLSFFFVLKVNVAYYSIYFILNIY